VRQGSLSRAAWQPQQHGALRLTGILVGGVHISRNDVGNGASGRDNLGLAVSELDLQRRVKAGRGRQGQTLEGGSAAGLERLHL
jgi:hypothetical protein